MVETTACVCQQTNSSLDYENLKQKISLKTGIYLDFFNILQVFKVFLKL